MTETKNDNDLPEVAPGEDDDIPADVPVGDDHLPDAPGGEDDLSDDDLEEEEYLPDHSSSTEVRDLPDVPPAASGDVDLPSTADEVPEKEKTTKEPTEVYLPMDVHESPEEELSADETPQTPTMDVPVEEKETEVENDPVETDEAAPAEDAQPDGQASTVRRTTRYRTEPERLQYSTPGNPLISVVQSLFHGLSTAFAEALRESQDSDTYPKLTYPIPSKPVTKQPLKCTGTCIASGGEGVTQTRLSV